MQRDWRWFDMNIKHNTLSILLIMVVVLMIAVTAFPGILLPTVYLGVSALMVVVAVLMFAAGYFFGTEKTTHSSIVTTTTTSTPIRIDDSGRYEEGRHIAETRTQKSSSSRDGDEKEEHTETVTTSSPNRSSDIGKRIEKTLTHKTSRSEGT